MWRRGVIMATDIVAITDILATDILATDIVVTDIVVTMVILMGGTTIEGTIVPTTGLIIGALMGTRMVATTTGTPDSGLASDTNVPGESPTISAGKGISPEEGTTDTLINITDYRR
jgi:hypothetical protein